MDKLNQKYIGQDVKVAYEDLTGDGFLVQIRTLLPQKDKDILKDEIVVKLTQEGNNITLITSMFKKYI